MDKLKKAWAWTISNLSTVIVIGLGMVILWTVLSIKYSPRVNPVLPDDPDEVWPDPTPSTTIEAGRILTVENPFKDSKVWWTVSPDVGVDYVVGKSYHLHFVGQYDPKAKAKSYALGILGIEGGEIVEKQKIWVVVNQPKFDPPEPPEPKPPEPKPPEPKPPEPKPPEPKVGLIKVLIVYEKTKADSYPATQQTIFSSKRVADYMTAHSPMESTALPGKKHPGYRIWDQDTDASAEPSPLWGTLLQRRPTDLPWIFITNVEGVVLHEGPLPQNVDETLKLLQKFGG